MLVTYHWKLNEDLIYGGAASTDYLQVIEQDEFPRMLVPFTDRLRIEKELPWQKLRAYASQEAELGDVAKRNQRWQEAIVHYQNASKLWNDSGTPRFSNLQANAISIALDALLLPRKPRFAFPFSGSISSSVKPLRNQLN